MSECPGLHHWLRERRVVLMNHIASAAANLVTDAAARWIAGQRLGNWNPTDGVMQTCNAITLAHVNQFYSFLDHREYRYVFNTEKYEIKFYDSVDPIKSITCNSIQYILWIIIICVN